MRKKLLLATIFLISNIFSFAQDDATITMADKMRSNGKIYVVVAVILTIFAGIVFYLIRLDKKISKLEKNFNS